jgi:hypothetical protein
MMNEETKSLKEVWDMKQACYEEVKDLPLKTALKKRLFDSLNSAKKLGFKFYLKVK